MRYGDTMELSEIIDMIAVINELENISEVEISIGEATLKVGKATQAPPPLPSFAPAATTGSPSVATSSPAAPAQAFSNQASPGQVKYALDLANKIGNGNMGSVVNGLAHSLEMTTDEILHPDQWTEEMTRDHASMYLDVLESQYNKMKKGAWS